MTCLLDTKDVIQNSTKLQNIKMYSIRYICFNIKQLLVQ